MSKSINKLAIIKINEIYIESKIAYYKHLMAANRYKKYYMNSTIPIIIISSLTTILASYNGSSLRKTFAVLVAILSGLTTICQALSSFLEYNTKFEAHISVSNKYINLVRYIETSIYTIENINDEKILTIIFKKIQEDLGQIQEIRPLLPAEIRCKEYRNVSCGSSKIHDDLTIIKYIQEDIRIDINE